nr:hypothetical protein [Streptococcus anginosus]
STFAGCGTNFLVVEAHKNSNVTIGGSPSLRQALKCSQSGVNGGKIVLLTRSEELAGLAKSGRALLRNQDQIM